MATTSFPWDDLKAETLRSICKDLGAGTDTKRNRENMITFLKDIEQRSSAAFPEENTAVPETPDVRQAAQILASLQKSDHIHADATGDVDMSSDEDEGDACVNGCQAGWLSPRLRYILQSFAAHAHHAVLDKGDLAVQTGDAGQVYLAQAIPSEVLPRGKTAIREWVRAFSMMFETISDIFEAGEIPNATRLEETLRADESKLKFYEIYAMQGADCTHVLEALVLGAKGGWETVKQELDKSDWESFSPCSEHELDWDMAEAALRN
ncbi:hypothetical protein FB451DRAFT_1549077 [Mycena latifolia]|nr:hypothetical protein FB451DRAFT_1549077 [Mycena latifolia]